MKLEIARMGARGDGEAETLDGVVHVPFTLPGEKVNAAVAGQKGSVVSVLEASPERVKPACLHFEVCGGCNLQHWKCGPMLEWKRRLVQDALYRRGIEAQVQQPTGSGPGERRRVTLSVRGDHGRTTTGFNAAHSHDIVEISECPVASPGLVGAFPAMRELARMLKVKGEGGHITLTETNTGLDVSFTGFDAVQEPLRRKLSEFALRKGFARLSSGEDIIVEPVKPAIDFGGVVVTPPPGGFLQACASIEAAMAGLVTKHFRKAKMAADLFAGSGAFTFRLARQTAVHAAEADKAAVLALDRARRGLQGFKAITVEQRDLFRRPLTVSELKQFDAVAFDPPRVGAEEQATLLARSSVRWVAAISCNPVTLARDLRLLIDGGYRLQSVTPFDQFLWSAHVEAVALLEKPDAKSAPRKIFR